MYPVQNLREENFHNCIRAQSIYISDAYLGQNHLLTIFIKTNFQKVISLISAFLLA